MHGIIKSVSARVRVFAVTCHPFFMAKVFINPDGDFEKDPSPEVPPEDQALIDHLKQYILSVYRPAATPMESCKRMSTEEIFNAFSRIYHNEFVFSKNDMAKWLRSEGFTVWDAGDLRFEWLLRSRSIE